MADQKRKVLLSSEEFEAIKSTLSATERGRAFLHDYLSLNKSAETQNLLSAIRRLEKTLVERELPTEVESYRLHTYEMYEAIERTKEEISKIKLESEDNNHFSAASDELDAIVSSTENATQSILEASEKIQDMTDKLRASGAEDTACDTIEEMAIEILMACSFQDLTGQRINKVVKALHYLESRVNKMIRIWGVDLSDEEERTKFASKADPHALEDDHLIDKRPDAHLLNGPQMDGEGVAQEDIDALFEVTPAASSTTEPEAVTAENIVDFSQEGSTPDAPRPVISGRDSEKDSQDNAPQIEEPAKPQKTREEIETSTRPDKPAETEQPDEPPLRVEGASEPLTQPQGNNADPLHRLSTGERLALFS